ncbi:MAG TPA: ABC transporter substrate-binding protein [Tepidisphaeraceae bacterium]
MRYFYLILFVMVLGLPFALRALQKQSEPVVEVEQATARLVVVTPHNGDIRREYGIAFDQWHRKRYGQGVTIDFRMPGGTSDMVKLLTSTFKENQTFTGLDVVWGGGDYTFYHDLQPKGILDPIHLDPKILRAAFPESSLAGVRLYDSTQAPDGTPTPQWVGACLSSFGIIYNSEVYHGLQMPPPQRWQDLTDPRLFRLIALADPAHSGSAAIAYMMVLQRSMADAELAFFQRTPQLKTLPRSDLYKRPEYHDAIAMGWKRAMGDLVLIAANTRYFIDSSEVVPNDVARGEAAAGMSIDFYARVTEGTVGSSRAHFVSPYAATAITPDAIGILHGVSGTRLTLATHFVEFLISPEGQRLWILLPGQTGGPRERALRRMPIRRDVYVDQTGWADHFNPFEDAGGFNQRGEWMALLSDTRPIWNAAWIDSRDDLLDAYQAILALGDSTKRTSLLGRLADLPVTLKDVEQRRDDRTAIEKAGGDINDWTARDRIAWSSRFRQHYEKVAAEARQ